MMTTTDLLALLPISILAVTPLVLLFTISAERHHARVAAISAVGLIGALASLPLAAGLVPRDVTPLLHIDAFGLGYVALAIAIALCVLAIGYRYVDSRESNPEEYYVLLLIATAGAAAMALSTHFVSFYLGLEILSVAQYGLMAYFRRDRRGTEAGMKYLVLAAASAAFLLFGMALVYAEIGSMTFAGMIAASSDQMNNSVVLLGVAMMCASIGFKLSIVPFHYWTPDIYDGAPLSVVAFASTAGKLGVFAVLVRYFVVPLSPVSEALVPFIAVTAVASMALGNVMALAQTGLKRLMAYSSIAHMGYVSVALLSYGAMAAQTVTFYLLGYAVASLTVFGVMMVLSAATGSDVDRIDDYRGLLRAHPVLGGVLVTGLLSLAGIPLTAGFFGKVYVVLAGAQEGMWPVLVVLAISSVAGAWYYLRVVITVCSAPSADASPVPAAAIPALSTTLLAVLAALVVAFGAYPAPILSLVQALHR